VTHRKPRLSVAQLRAVRATIEASDVLPLRRLRDLALFDAMCDLLARRSEIVGLRLRDLDLAAATVRISHSKTDQAGRGTVFRISTRTAASLDAPGSAPPACTSSSRGMQAPCPSSWLS
jgi:integrase